MVDMVQSPNDVPSNSSSKPGSGVTAGGLPTISFVYSHLSASRSQTCAIWSRTSLAWGLWNVGPISKQRSARRRYSSALFSTTVVPVFVALSNEREQETALSRAESQPEKSEASSDNEGDPAYRLRHRPVSDDDGPLRKNPHQVEERHYGEDYQLREKTFCVHER